MKRLGVCLLMIFTATGIGSCGIEARNVNRVPLTLTAVSSQSSPTQPPVPEPTKTPDRLAGTRVVISPELYLDEASSPDNMKGDLQVDTAEHYSNRSGYVHIYQFGPEQWVTALTWTRAVPIETLEDPAPSEVELRQHYLQVWADRELLYAYPVDGISMQPKKLLRYDEHWIFWFMNDWSVQGGVVKDGTLLNDLHDYDSAFSLFLLDGRPFFFFRRGDSVGVSFDGREIILPYATVRYGPVCCEGGGPGKYNPRATDTMVGFYTVEGDSDYKYVEIGLR